MRKPKIAMITFHGCIRVFKQAWALMEHGYEVHLAAMVPPFGWNAYESFNMYLNPEDLHKTIKTLDKAGIDVFHVHNEPDVLVRMTREATSKPIVFDIHDMDSLRLFGDDEPGEEEVNAFKMADAFIHVSDAIKDYAIEQYPILKQHFTIYSFVNEKFTPDPKELPDVCWNSLVYQGGLSESDDITPTVKKEFEPGQPNRVIFNVRYYGPMVESFLSQGYFVNMQAATELKGHSYESMGAYVSGGPVPYSVMLRGLRPHGFGFVGSCISAPLMEKAMPNKFFEYMSQGVVPVCLFCEAVEDWVKTYDCGIVLEDFENLRLALQDGERVRKKMLQHLGDWTMEKQVPLLAEIYESVL